VVRGFSLAAAGSVLALSFPAAAQQGTPQPIKRADVAAKLDASFAASDTNHDGSLSAAEIQAEQNKELQNVRTQLQAKIKAAFNQLDTNKDGQLSLAEFSAQTLAAVKPTETAAQIVQRLDTNHDGKVSAAEFRAGRLAAFDKVDTNHDGVLTPEEIRRAEGGK
jgi:Ca2+-binding EF-hand superfamily protein